MATVRDKVAQSGGTMCALSYVAPWAALWVRDEPGRAAGAFVLDAAVAAGAVWAAGHRDQLIAAPLWAAGVAAALVLCAAVVRLVTAWGSAGEAAWHRERAGKSERRWPARVVGTVGVLLTAALVAGVGAGAWTVLRLDGVFAHRDATVAMPEPLEGEAPTTTTSSSSLGAGGRINVLLVGTDAGRGRVGARTDSMNLVSVDTGTGDAWMVGLPRNLQHAPMPQSVKGLFPNGFDDLLNAVWGWAEAHPQLAPDPQNPGESTLKAVVANITGQPVQYVVRGNMAALDRIVDALGGIQVENLKSAPLTPLQDDLRPVPKVLAPGVYQMDGPLAVAFSRSRHADSDYGRMARQRCVLEAVLKKGRSSAVVTGWATLVDQVSQNVRTDMPRSTVATLASAAGRVDPGSVRVLSLVPPQVNTARPDWVRIRQMVAQIAQAAAAAPAGPVEVSGGAELRADDNSASLRPTTTTTSTTAVPPEGGATTWDTPYDDAEYRARYGTTTSTTISLGEVSTTSSSTTTASTTTTTPTTTTVAPAPVLFGATSDVCRTP